MELKKFLVTLKKHKFGIIIIPLLVMGITFSLVRNQPDVYVSKTRLSAGLTEGTQQLITKENQMDSKINQTFSNLIQIMQLKAIYDQVSYQLILHDLTTDEPFRKKSKLITYLNQEAAQHAVDVFNKFYQSRKQLSVFDKDQNGLNEVIKSMGYNYEALRDKIKVNRIENSDFVDIEYESENPMLSAFVVNTLAKEFIAYYTMLAEQNGRKSVDFLNDMVMKKKDSLEKKTNDLKNYKIDKHVLNLNEQAKNLFSQISEFETRLELTEKEVKADSGAISNLNAKLDPLDKASMEAKLDPLNKEIIATQEKLKLLRSEEVV